ncbi:restriction endonuclease subunit S [Enterococcus faecium]
MSNDTQPEIRFPGFTDDWEERKFQWLIDQNIIDSPIDGNHGEKHPKSSDYVESGIPFLMAKDIKNNKVDIKNCTFISKETAGALDKGFAKNGDILLTHKATIGEVGILEGVNTEYAMLTPQITYYRILDFSRLDRNFFSSVLRSSVFQKNIHKIAKQSTRPYVGITEQRKLTIYFPIKIEEQQKIGTFFKQLDDTIALHQRKLDLLKETKKGFLQKMFPKNGAKVPEVRFPGFTGDWEERKLGEVVVFLNGRAFKQQELLDSGKYRVLRVGNFNTNDRWYYSNLELEEDKYANKGDLLYLWATSFGPEMWNEERVIYHYHIWKLKFLSKELDKQYLYTWLLTDKEKIKESTNGTTMVHVTKGGIEQRTFQFPPDINEQQKIGAFFKQLDDTIALHQRKLDLLKETKKGFLQKMFV